MEKGAVRVSGKTLGIIGFGRIGMATACRAKAFHMNVIFYDPYVPRGIEKSLSVKRVNTLDELLQMSDVISIHCWLSNETRYLINKKNIFHCKKGAFLVNTARGPIVEEAALVQALKTGHLAGAALDVQEVEPYTDGHLKDVPNLILTPHVNIF